MPIADVLADKFTMQDVNLSRFEAGERVKIRRFLMGLSDQLTVLLDKTLPDDEQTFSRRRLQALFKVTDLTIQNTYAKIAKAHDDSMLGLAEVSANQTVQAINKTIGVSLVEVGVSEAVLKAMVNDDISLGLPAKEWWDGQSTRLRQRFQNTIRQGVFAGETLSDLKRRVRGRRENGFKDGIMEATSRDAEALIRTSVQSIAQSARNETFKANDDVIKGQMWLSTLDTRTSEICMALSGSAWDLDGNILPESATDMEFPGPPPAHFSCFPGDTHVSASELVTHKSCRWYEGDLIVVRTASGRKISCTPNHPILTNRGWVPAHLLQKGHNVVRSLRAEWKAPSINPYNNKMTARIEDFSVSGVRSHGVLSCEMPVSAKDFHGDVSGSKVAIITSNGYLWGQFDASLMEHRLKHGLQFRHADPSLLASQGDLLTMPLAMALPPNGVMCSLRQSQTFIGSRSSHANIHGITPRSKTTASLLQATNNRRGAKIEFLGDDRYGIATLVESDDFIDRRFDNATPGFYPSLLENSPDSRKSDIELASKIMSGQSGPIAFDEIIGIDRKLFHGNVYNLQTSNMWYMANGIIVHNCRSSLVPILKSYAELIRDAKGDEELAAKMDKAEKKIPKSTQASMDGQVPASMSYTDWLKKQPAERQIEALGESKWELWKRGEIQLTDLIDNRNRPLSLKELEAR